MAEEGIPAESPAADAPAAGTAVAEQPESAAPAFDAIAANADYTRKTQELAQERAVLAQQRQQLEYQQQQWQQQQQMGYTQQGTAPQHDPLSEQFGHDGAQAIQQYIGTIEQRYQAQQILQQYRTAQANGSSQYGEAFAKHDYFDPQTGMQRNKIVDASIASGLSLEQAWRAYNPIDEAKIRQQAIDEYHQQQGQKAQGTPASRPPAAPAASGQGHARNIREAAAQARSDLGIG